MSQAMAACVRARDAWQRAGRPGATDQLELFPVFTFRTAEAERARKVDRPRRRKRA